MRLGAELRKMREAAGMSAREAGELLGGDQAHISHIESGRWGVSAERVRRLTAFYSTSDGQLVDVLCEMAQERDKGWWEEYRDILPPDFLNIAELEHHAAHLRYAQALTIPGPLQTEAYARALFRQVIPQLPDDEIDARVDHRLKRQAILDSESPTPLEAIIHEAALRMRYGGTSVARGQLGCLLDASERQNVTIRIIPFTANAFIGSAQAMLYASGPLPQLDTVQLDGALGGVFLHGNAQLDMYRVTYRMIGEIALDAAESRGIINRIVQEV